MTLPLLVRKSLRQHAFSTLITAVSIGLAAGLWMSVWTIRNQSTAAFSGSDGGFDAVLGARASKLQLVLNAIFHLEASPGNITFQDLIAIQAAAGVEAAIPLATGDSYKGSRIVGTTAEFFVHAQSQEGEKLQVRPGGRLFEMGYQEAVVGSYVAQQIGLQVGQEFHPQHGLESGGETHHEECYLVVGVLEPSNTPADQVIWIPLEGVQRMGGHDPAAATDLSAILVKLVTPAAGLRLDQVYNRQGRSLTFAWPISTIVAQLFEKLAWLSRVLELVAYLVALVAIGSVVASLNNSMNERKRDIAILRALGAHRSTVFGAIVAESTAIAALGCLIGWGFHAIILTITASIIRSQTGVVLNTFAFEWVLITTPLLLTFLGAVAGILPALKAYRTPVAEFLHPVS